MSELRPLTEEEILQTPVGSYLWFILSDFSKMVPFTDLYPAKLMVNHSTNKGFVNVRYLWRGSEKDEQIEPHKGLWFPNYWHAWASMERMKHDNG